MADVNYLNLEISLNLAILIFMSRINFMLS